MARKSKRTSKRPPKSWMEHCVAHVKAAGRRAKRRVKSPEAVCGAEWYHKMSGATKKRAKKRHPEKGRAHARTR